MEKRRRIKTKKFTYKMQANLLLAFGIVVIALIILLCVLIKINAKDGNKYAKNVLKQQSYTSSEIAYKRGDIKDRNNIVMATSIKVYNLIVDPEFVLKQVDGKYKYRDTVVDIISQYFEMNKDEVIATLEEKKDLQYYIFKKKVSSELYDGYEKFVERYKKSNKEAIIKGIWFEEEYERTYPLNELASSVVGFTYDKNAGNWGIEGQYNDELNGTTGRSFGYYDSELNLERTVKNAEDGNSVVTTIDSNIQKIVEDHIKKFQKDVGSKNASVVIADPNNGEIIAMASYNGMYDLNNPRDLTPWYSEAEISKMTSAQKLENLNKVWRNYCVSDSYEPGSTYKPFVVAAGLEEGILKGDETYVCDGKQVVVKGAKPIRCAKRSGHGTVSLKQALMFSCNDALMQIGQAIGKDIFAKYQTHFGFGNKTGIDLMGESTGIVYGADKLNPLELATSSFGQGLNVTMVQMVSAFSSLVNGGNYYQPHVVKKILNSNGAVIKSIEPVIVKKTVSKKVSENLINYMEATVMDGTANKAQVEGYRIGGKTGTAQKLPRSENKYLVSFLGFAPCDNPKFVIYSIVDELNDDNQAQSTYAQELAAGIMKDIFPFLDVFKTGNTKDKDKDKDNTKPVSEDDKKKAQENANENSEDMEFGALDEDTGGKKIIDEGGVKGDVTKKNEDTLLNQ